MARWGRLLAVALALLGLLGGGLVYAAGPGLVAQAGREGIGFSVIDRRFKGAPAAQIEKKAVRARKLGAAGAGGALLGAALVFALTRPRFARKVVGRATPGALGATRALVCGVLLLIALQDDLGSAAWLPREMREPMGFLELVRKLPGVSAVLYSEWGLRAIDWGTTALLALGVLGLWTRVVLPLSAAGFFLHAGVVREYSWFTHQGLVPLYALSVLCFTPCGDGFSLDRLRRDARGEPVPPREESTFAYGWARYAIMAVIAMQYVFAGASKLRNGGWDWWCAENLRQIMLTDTLSPMAHEWRVSLLLVEAPDALFATIGLCALLFELAGGLVLVWPRGRWMVGLLLIGIHVGIYLMQNVLFYDLALLQLMLFNFTALRRWVGQRLNARRGQVRVLGGASPRGRRVLEGLDLFERLEWTNETAAELTVEHRGTVRRGADAVRTLGAVLPAGWLLLPAVALPALGAQVARALQAPAAQPSASAPLARPTPGLGPRLALCGLVGAMGGVWALQGEFYPLTSVQMYSQNRKNNPGTVHYNRVLAHYDSGATGRAYLDEAIGVFTEARYRRLLDMSLSEAQRPIAARAFQTIADIMNRDAPPGQRVQKFEIQRRRWDYHAAPSDPEYGQTIEQVFFDVTRGAAAAVEPQATRAVVADAAAR